MCVYVYSSYVSSNYVCAVFYAHLSSSSYPIAKLVKIWMRLCKLSARRSKVICTDVDLDGIVAIIIHFCQLSTGGQKAQPVGCVYP